MTGRRKEYPLLSDEDLMPLVAEGDALAFAALYDRHARAAYLFAYRLTGGRQAAEDLTQDAFLKAWRSAGTYRVGRGSVRRWVLTIVHNRGIDQLRSGATRRRTREKARSEAETSQPCEAFAEAWQGVLLGQVREVMGALPTEQRAVVELAHFSGHTQVEIAGMLGLPLGTVKGRLRLGLRKIRNRLGPPVKPAAV